MSMSTNIAQTTSSDVEKCSIRGCKVVEIGCELVACANKPCPHVFHLACFHSLVVDHNNLDILKDASGAAVPCCTKKCYGTLEPKYNGTSQLVWEKDGALGPEDPNNSLNLLLEWMTTEGNYACFCGNAEGKTKLKICEEVASLLKGKGVQVEHSKKNIFDKIQALEKMFKVAHEWAGQTGQGIDISKQAFGVAVSNRCC